MSFSSDSALSSLLWPLSKPVDADSRISEVEVEVVGLFEELRDRMLRYLMAIGLSVHDGEEIVQESFLLLFQHLCHGKPRHNLRGWVFRVARNLALKKRSANRLCLQRMVDLDFVSAHQAVDLRPNPEEQLANNLRQTQLLSVVGALSEQDQSCLCLRAEGLRYREIAKILEISLGSVAASLARSLAKLERASGV